MYQRKLIKPIFPESVLLLWKTIPINWKVTLIYKLLTIVFMYWNNYYNDWYCVIEMTAND